MDSLIKYRLLEDSRFDLVFVYHAINETRNNNVPPELFRDDYSHTEFYADVAVPEAHPESDYFRLPAVLHRMYNNFLVSSGLREQLGMREHDKWVEYGCDIKTDRPFRHNLEEMARIAHRRGETLILSTFAIHIPPDYSLEKFKNKELAYAGAPQPHPALGQARVCGQGSGRPQQGDQGTGPGRSPGPGGHGQVSAQDQGELRRYLSPDPGRVPGLCQGHAAGGGKGPGRDET